MRRRSFMILLGGAAVAAPLVGRAQQPAGVARIGILSDTVLFSYWEPIVAQVWRDLGWVEGRNLVIERRYARAKSTKSCRASPPSWLAYSRTSSSLLAPPWRARPRTPRRRSRSSLLGPKIRLVPVLYPEPTLATDICRFYPLDTARRDGITRERTCPRELADCTVRYR